MVLGVCNDPSDRSQREYIRHPIDIPIHIAPNEKTSPQDVRLNNVSAGGLAFRTHSYIAPGRRIEIEIHVVQPKFKVSALVQWCHQIDDEFEIGVQFSDKEDAYRVRMVEQVCHIEHYRLQIWRQEKRLLTGEAAAQEWIKKFAHDFPAG